MTAPKDHIERDLLARKKSELFALCITVFIALNCLSYFVRSGEGPPLHTIGYSLCESIGFPFVVSAAGGPVATLFFRWYALVADLFIALLVSWLIAKFHARKLPFLIREQAVPCKYSILSLLVPMLCMAVLLLVFRLVFCLTPQQQTLIYNSLFLVSGVVGVIWLKFRNLSWSWLAVAGVGLSLLAVLATFPHDLDPYIIVKCVMRGFVAGGSILSVFVIAVTMFRLLRHMDDLAEQARERTPENEADHEQESKRGRS